jgi:glycosyltransferase involved in cell wall biosynthesis
MRRRPFLVHLHGSSFDRFFEESSRLVKLSIRTLLSRATRVIVLGERWRQWALTAGVAGGRVVVLPNAVSMPSVPPGKVPGRVAFVGRVGSRKGAQECIRAAALLADRGTSVELHFAGDIEEGFDLPQRPNLHFLGWIDRPQTQQLLLSSEVFLLPSQAEGLPLSLLEAMAAQAVPVVTQAGSMAEAVDDEVGVLLKDGTASEIAEALEGLMMRRDLLQSRGTRARERALHRYDIREYVVRYAELLADCCSRGGQP